MPAAAQLRSQIEAALARRIPSALSPAPRVIRPTEETGIPALDDLLGGGLPVGAISEIVGPECSGRTSLALAFLARITQQGKVCAWVDVSDALHPESAAAAGVDLDRLLWVRCGGAAAKSVAPQEPSAVEPVQTRRVQLGGNSPHPRSEANGLPLAIGDLLANKPQYRRDKTIGTPGAANRRLGMSSYGHDEQVASDRLPSRRGEYVLEQREAYEPRCAEPQRKPRPLVQMYEPLNTFEGGNRKPAANFQRKPWSRLDQALRVTDLLLQAGGFSAIVLDMGGIAAEFASRVPMATWFRYRAAAERTQASVLLLTQHACAKSSAGVVLELDAAQPLDSATLFTGFASHAELGRQRFVQDEKVVPLRKPPQRAGNVEWRSTAAWVGRK